ncbi:hypothetical protein [Rhodococcus opacus]|uniref:Mce-associated membrane protein n=1 Tax=Rhodococcus opacus TaxID=37919 RepID=A0A2S8IMB6_RHOOP|nr:hypothetical protein [Rhodococcus opacus]PQP15924.1 hypothetical protein C5613_37375 [Rhodococcus opacus]
MRKALILLAVIIAAATALLYSSHDNANTSGTATPQSTATAPETGTRAPQRPEPTTPEEVARQAMTVAFTWAPTTDESPTSGFRRATQWFTPDLAARLTSDVRNERGPSLQWQQWINDNARVIADVAIGCSGCPPDTDTTAHRVATITQTAVTGDTTHPVEPDTTVWLTLTKSDGRWLIDNLTY